LRSDPKHAEAHIPPLGAYHAEVVDKMGAMVGKLTYGASKEIALKHFDAALKLTAGIGDRLHRICQCAGPAVRRQAHG
jgi:hypothetical protein